MLFLRFIANGLLATAVHYVILVACIEWLMFNSAGAANSVAAIFGIAASFLGSRYFVFKRRDQRIASQASKFIVLYAIMALFHGLFLTFWSDWNNLDYRIGFVIASSMQVLISFLGNKILVFGR